MVVTTCYNFYTLWNEELEMIEFTNVVKTYQQGNNALNGATMQIEDGEFVFLIGPSVSGKSTIIKLITGELKPTSGTVHVNGYSLERIRKREIPYMRRTVGVVFQDFRLIENMTVYENVAFVMKAVGASRKKIREDVPRVLELVGIATSSGIHAEIALYCIDRGIHVIIEKPMAMSMADAEEIIRRSEQKGVKVSACHQNRFNVAIQELRRAVEAGRFGRLSHGSIHVRWNRNEGSYTQAPWRGTWAQDGGALMNQCIHGIDLLRWMMGDEIEEIYGVTRQQFHDYLECEDIGMAVVKFKNGAVGTIEGTTNVYPRNLEETLYLFGETGTVKIGGTSTNNIE